MTKPLVLRFQANLPVPPVPLADVKGLRAIVAPVRPVTEDELAERFALVLRAAATVQARQRGEAVQRGDEVEVALLCYANGRPLPLGVSLSSVLTADEDCAIPSVGTKLVGLKVGSSAQFQAHFPPGYPVAALASKQAVFLVDVKRASTVTLPDLRGEQAIAALGLGATLEAVMDAVAQQLLGEHEADFQARRRLAVAVELVRRTPFDLPRAFLEHEVGRRWLERDGKHLARRGWSETELQNSYEAWLAEPILVREVERDVRAALLIRALLDKKVVVVEAGELTAGALAYAVSMGATTEKAVTDLLKKEDPLQSPVVNALVINAALDRLAATADLSSPFA